MTFNLRVSPGGNLSQKTDDVETGKMIKRIMPTISTSFLLCFLLVMCPSSQVWAGAPIQADRDMSLLYFVTHLHPTIYVILFGVFLLSMVNLAVQTQLVSWFKLSLQNRLRGNISRDSSGADGFIGRIGKKSRPKNFRKPIRGPESYRMSKEPLQDGIVSVRSVSSVSADNAEEIIPTPLDGEDHRLPEFSLSSNPKSKANKVKSHDSQKETTTPTKEFKFSSAVDLPSPEEIERRGKEKIVVTGRVIDPLNSGLATAVVYLVDKDGNKMGQSCRTNSDSGAYRVQSNEGGAHSINVYKRGYVMNSDGPIKLPAKNGKIEGFDVHMMPEGCLIHGKVSSTSGQNPIEGLTVKCDCRSEQYKFSSTTNSKGAFQALGAPLNSECVIQVLSPDGNVLLDSKPFETVQKKQIFMDLKVDYPESEVRQRASEQYENIDIVIEDPESRASIQSSAV